MALATVNVANFTPHDRTEVVTTVVSLPQGVVFPGGSHSIVATDPLGDAVDRDCEWYSFGSLYLDGSCRRVRILFPVSVSAGVAAASRSDAMPYAYYRSKSVSVDVAQRAPSIPAYTQHASVDLSAADLTFSYRCARIGYGATPTRSASFTAAAGHVVAQVTGAVTNPSTELDTDWVTRFGTGRWVRSYVVPVRILPEMSGGVEEEASMWGRLFVEVPTSAISGLGQVVKWWWEWGNSLVTSDDPSDATSPARDPAYTGYAFYDHPKLVIDGPATSIACSDAFMRDAVVAGSVTTIELLQIDSTSTNPTHFHTGSRREICGSWGFGDVSALSSWSAAKWCETTWQRPASGDAVWMDAVADNWGAHGNFGGYGSMPKRAWGHWATDAEMVEAAGKVCHEDRESYRTRKPWRNSLHGCLPRSGAQGGQADFGQIHHWWNAMAAFPDFRAARLSAQMEGFRKYSHRMIDGEPFDPTERVKTGGPSELLTHVVMYEAGEPKTQAQSYPSWADLLGKTNANEPYYETRRNPNNWHGSALSHLSANNAFFFGMMTGDRCFINSMLLDLRNVAACSSPQAVAAVRSGYTEADAGLSSGRTMGRPLRFAAHCHALIEPGPIANYLIQKDLYRIADLYDWMITGSTTKPEWKKGLAGDLDKDVPCAIFSHYPQYYPSRPAWTTWLQGMMSGGVWATICQAEKSHSAATIVDFESKLAKVKALLAKLTRGIFLHGYRKLPEPFGQGGTNGQWWGFYATDWKWSGNRGDPIRQINWNYLTGNNNPNTGLHYFDSPGSSIPNRWGIPAPLIAPLMSPGDPEIAADWEKIDGLTTACIFPVTAATRDQNSRYGFGQLGEAWMSWAAVIDDPFTAYSDGPGGGIVYGSATLSCAMGLESMESDPTPYIHRPTSDLAMTMGLEANAGSIPPLLNGSATMACSMSLTAAGDLSQIVQWATATLPCVMGLEADTTPVIYGQADVNLSMSLLHDETITDYEQADMNCYLAVVVASTDAMPIVIVNPASATLSMSASVSASGQTINPLSVRDTSGTSNAAIVGVDPRTSQVSIVRTSDGLTRSVGRRT